jgi:hypothetical protein
MDNPGGTSYTPPPPPPPPGPAAGADLIYPSSVTKDPTATLLLNLFLMCVGYFYLGQWQKGLAALAAGIVLGVPTCGGGFGVVAVFAAVDGYLQAQQLQAGLPLAQWTFFKDHR